MHAPSFSVCGALPSTLDVQQINPTQPLSRNPVCSATGTPRSSRPRHAYFSRDFTAAGRLRTRAWFEDAQSPRKQPERCAVRNAKRDVGYEPLTATMNPFVCRREIGKGRGTASGARDCLICVLTTTTAAETRYECGHRCRHRARTPAGHHTAALRAASVAKRDDASSSTLEPLTAIVRGGKKKMFACASLQRPPASERCEIHTGERALFKPHQAATLYASAFTTCRHKQADVTTARPR
ncbi:hypothetical protein MRX96_027092 [Rhipicephalus microplus]